MENKILHEFYIFRLKLLWVFLLIRILSNVIFFDDKFIKIMKSLNNNRPI